MEVEHSCSQEENAPVFIYSPPKRQGKHKKPSELTVKIRGEISCDLKVRPRDGMDRLGERLGLARSLSTGDSVFDTVYFVEPSREEFAEALLSQGQAREDVRSLLQAGFQSVTWLEKPGEIRASWSGYSPRGETDIQVVGKASLALESLRTLSLPLEKGSVPYWQARFQAGTSVLGLLGLAVLGLGAYSIFLVTRRFEPVIGNWFDAAPWLLLFLLLVSVLAYLFYRATPRGHTAFAIAVGANLFVSAILAYPIFFALNGFLDKEPTEKISIPIQSVGTEKVKKGLRYYMILDSQIHGKHLGKMRMDYVDYTQFKDGKIDSIELEYGPGFFGYPWKQSMQYSKKGPGGWN